MKQRIQSNLSVRQIGIFLVLAVFLSLICQLESTLAQQEKSPDVKIEIEKLTLFKNGLGFIISNGELPHNSKSIRIGQLPIPSFGTFWVGYPKDVKLQSLITSIEEVEKEVPALSISQLLRLNTGRKVVLHTSDKDIEGTIISAPLNPEEQPERNPYFMGQQLKPNPYIIDYGTQVPSNEIISIKTEKGIVVLNPASVLRIEFADENPLNITTSKQKIPSIRMELEKPAGGENITVSYLARGITWSPGYLIDLSDSKTAKFSAHALVINELADFKNVKLQLVTGFPNIKFGDISSPIAKNQSLAEFLTALSGSTRQSGNQYLYSQGMLSNVRGGRSEEFIADIVTDYPTATEGVAVEDLFFYPVSNFTLKRNETAWLPLFTAEMPYKHIYTWKIGDFVDKEERYSSQTGSEQFKSAEEVWHSCRIVNTLNMPLTTAATEFVTDDEFTGQDVCYYTPPKGEATIRINKALNVVAEQTEIEVERTRNASVFHGYHYDLVKVRGELKLNNKLDKTINVEISKELSGAVIESSPKCKDVKTAKGLKRVNEKHILTWEIELAAGDERKLTYQYQVYIRE